MWGSPPPRRTWAVVHRPGAPGLWNGRRTDRWEGAPSPTLPTPKSEKTRSGSLDGCVWGGEVCECDLAASWLCLAGSPRGSGALALRILPGSRPATSALGSGRFASPRGTWLPSRSAVSSLLCLSCSCGQSPGSAPLRSAETRPLANSWRCNAVQEILTVAPLLMRASQSLAGLKTSLRTRLHAGWHPHQMSTRP